MSLRDRFLAQVALDQIAQPADAWVVVFAFFPNLANGQVCKSDGRLVCFEPGVWANEIGRILVDDGNHRGALKQGRERCNIGRFDHYFAGET